jgi:hypothetical protein
MPGAERCDFALTPEAEAFLDYSEQRYAIEREGQWAREVYEEAWHAGWQRGWIMSSGVAVVAVAAMVAWNGWFA